MPSDHTATDLITIIGNISPKLDDLTSAIGTLRQDLGLNRAIDGLPIFISKWEQEEGALCLYVGQVKVADISAMTFFGRSRWHLRFWLPTLRPWGDNGQSYTRLPDAKAEADLRVKEFLTGIWGKRDAA